MSLLAFAIELKNDADAIRVYEANHASPFPEVAEHWRDIGVTWSRIFRTGPRLVMLININDPAKLGTPWRADIANRMREWDTLMTDLQVALPNTGGTSEMLGKWTRMDEIYTFGPIG